MNRFFISLALAVLMTSGCTTMPDMNPPGTRPVIFLQTGVMLQVFNLCSQTPGRVYPSTGGEFSVPPGPPTYIPMAPMPLMNTRAISATYQVYEGNVLTGSVSRSFSINRNQGTQTVQWIIGGSGGGGGQNVVTSRCPGPSR